MGYVYTPAEYEGDRIATPESYKVAMAHEKGGLKRLYDEGLIFGANINGSAMHGESSPGVDIDVVTVTNCQEAENTLNRLHNEIMDSFHVYVEHVPIERGLAQSGYHTVDFFYALYMKTFCKDGVIGNDPFLMIEPRKSWNNPKEEFKERISGNLGKLSKMKASISPDYNEEHCDFLEKVLRQPIYVAIGMLRLKYGNYPSEDGRPLSKPDCCEMYKDEFPEMSTKDLFMVLAMRVIYRDFLEKGKGNPSEYVELLGEIEAIYPDARRFIEKNLGYLISH
jgi:hypothetical protein